MKKKVLNVEYNEKKVEIPYFTLIGDSPGPQIFLSGGMHGDELNGIAVIDEFLDWAQKISLEDKLKGTIIAFPVLNPEGFSKMQREVPHDKKDLNRCFGIASPTSISEQIGLELDKKLLSKTQLGIDFHDAGRRSILLPHARVHVEDNDRTLNLGRIFGTQLILKRKGKPNMMSVHLNDAYHIPVLTIEIGGGNRLFSEFIQIGVRGIRNILDSLDMFPSKQIISENQFLLTDRLGAYAQKASQIKMHVNLGEFVHSGEIIGELYFPDTREKKLLKSPKCGMIFTLCPRNQIPEVDIMYSILETKECHVPRNTTDKFMKLPEVKIKKIKM